MTSLSKSTRVLGGGRWVIGSGAHSWLTSVWTWTVHVNIAYKGLEADDDLGSFAGTKCSSTNNTIMGGMPAVQRYRPSSGSGASTHPTASKAASCSGVVRAV